MKLLQILLALVCVFSTITCKKDNCHRTLTLKNTSGDTVILAQVMHNNTLCNLDGGIFPPGSEFPLKHRDCWEDILANGKTWDLYIVDRSKYNDPSIFYNCDSIESINKVLKHYVLSLDDLKKNGFTIVYP